MSEATTASTAEHVTTILSRYRGPILTTMRAALDRPHIEHIGLIRYHLGWEDEHGASIEGRAGKLLRPALCLLCCEAVGGEPRRALPAAAAIELLHNFTLIHDDIEDRSATRHGRPTLWTFAGIAQAINAGDGLFAIAQRTLLDLPGAGLPAERTLEAARRLNDACIELCEGQHADLSFESRPSVTLAEYETMVRGKSAVLIAAAAAIGAIVGGAAPAAVDAYSRYGLALGLGFQIQDDVLGIWGAPDTTGKPAGDDIRARKKSYPVVYAMQHQNDDGRAELARICAREMLSDGDVQRVIVLLDGCSAREAASAASRRHAGDALAALQDVEMSAERRGDLESLAAYAIDRST